MTATDTRSRANDWSTPMRRPPGSDQTPPSTNNGSTPTVRPSAGDQNIGNGHSALDTQSVAAVAEQTPRGPATPAAAPIPNPPGLADQTPPPTAEDTNSRGPASSCSASSVHAPGLASTPQFPPPTTHLAVAEQTSSASNDAPSAGDQNIGNGQTSLDTQTGFAVAEQTPRGPAKAASISNHAPPGLADLPEPPPLTIVSSTPKAAASAGDQNIGNGQFYRDPQRAAAVAEQTPRGPARAEAISSDAPPGLADPVLILLAEILDDLERTRIANENRLRQMTRNTTDSDGEERGLGLDERHPDVARLADIVGALGKLEHQSTLNLQRAMRRHPLGPWVKSRAGVGDKQAARLLAAIGDPYWNTLHDRPRTVSELWAYCGLHVLPVGHPRSGLQTRPADGASLRSDPGQTTDADGQGPFAGVAAKRRKGIRANWSTAAKTRAYLIAESCMKQLGSACKRPDGPPTHGEDCTCSAYRLVYDDRKAATVGRVHVADCVRCGPSGHPAAAGSPWSDAHRHADALRVSSKAILRDLWREARRIHGDDTAA